MSGILILSYFSESLEVDIRFWHWVEADDDVLDSIFNWKKKFRRVNMTYFHDEGSWRVVSGILYQRQNWSREITIRRSEIFVTIDYWTYFQSLIHNSTIFLFFDQFTINDFANIWFSHKHIFLSFFSLLRFKSLLFRPYHLQNHVNIFRNSSVYVDSYSHWWKIFSTRFSWIIYYIFFCHIWSMSMW